MCGGCDGSLDLFGNCERQLAKKDQEIALHNMRLEKEYRDEQLAYSKERDAKQWQLASDQFDWQKGEAKAEKERKQQIVDEMLAEATVTAADYQKVSGDASADVAQSFKRSDETRRRALSRMNVNPNSGRAEVLDRNMAIEEARVDAGSQTLARTALKDYSDKKKDGARRAGLGLNDMSYAIQDPRLGLGSSYLATLNSSVNQTGANARYYHGSSNDNYQRAGDAGRELVGDMTGAVASAYGYSQGTKQPDRFGG